MATFEEIIETALRRSSLSLPPVEDRKRLRQATGVRGDALARAVGIKPATFYRIERGEQDPRGEVLERLVAFYRAAGDHDERSNNMSHPFGLSSPVSYERPPVIAGRTTIEPQDLAELLEALRAAKPDGITIVVNEAGVRRYGGDTEAIFDRAAYLANRGLVDRQPHDEWKNGEIVKQTLTLTITEAGEQALEEATTLAGASS